MAWRSKLWPLLLGILLIIYGITRLGWISIGGDIIAILEIVTGILVLINR